MKTRKKIESIRFPWALRSALCVLIPAISLGVEAKVLDMGGPDWEIRLDNTLRYNAAMRVEKQNADFLRSPGYDDTENKFDRGDLVSNRFDLLTELDVVFQQRHGVRVSTAVWYDHAYHGNPKPNSGLDNSGNYINNRYNSYANRYVAGMSGEILDAFAFSNFYIGDVGFGVKLGKHNVYWGESLFTIGNGIAYSQGPVDSIKSASAPGSPAKELFLPIEQFSAEISLTDELSVGLQYAFDWKPYRLVPGGTFFAASDGSRSDISSPPSILSGTDYGPDKKRGDHGVNVRWSPWQLGGTVGAYYRKFDEKLPWSFTQVGAGPTNVRLGFARDTELYGLSLTKNIASMSVAGEVSLRKNTALVSRSGYVVNATSGQEPTYSQMEGARGDSWHALVNAIYMLPRTSLWEGGQLQAELTYNRLDRVTSDPDDRFNFKGGSGCTSTYSRHCVTRDAWGIQARFTPEWPQILPGWNLAMPVNIAYGIQGNSPTLGGTNEGVYTWSIGVEGTYRNKHNFGLSYIDSYAPYTTTEDGMVTTPLTIGSPVQNNHGRVAFNYRVSF